MQSISGENVCACTVTDTVQQHTGKDSKNGKKRVGSRRRILAHSVRGRIRVGVKKKNSSPQGSGTRKMGKRPNMRVSRHEWG